MWKNFRILKQFQNTFKEILEKLLENIINILENL